MQAESIKFQLGFADLSCELCMLLGRLSLKPVVSTEFDRKMALVIFKADRSNTISE